MESEAPAPGFMAPGNKAVSRRVMVVGGDEEAPAPGFMAPADATGHSTEGRERRHKAGQEDWGVEAAALREAGREDKRHAQGDQTALCRRAFCDLG